jgi:hypothetical protein
MKTPLLCLALGLTLLFHVQAQNPIKEPAAAQQLTRFARNAALFASQYAQEKAYLHFDNTGYFMGETIWFKAYVVSAINNSPSTMSKTLYVELLSQEGELLEQQKLCLQNGIACGSLLLRDSLSGGYYEVRAYTRAMLNFGQETVFSRIFPVYSPPLQDGNYEERIMKERKYKVPDNRTAETNKTNTLNLSFFPEGGNRLTGYDTRIAFKATDADGKAVDLKGSLRTPEGNTLASFETLHEGMGDFILPSGNERAKAYVDYQGKTYSFDLPKPVSGYSMQCLGRTEDPASYSLRLQRSKDLPADSVAIAVGCRGKLVDFRILSVPDQGCTLSFEGSHFPEGINQFTLYDTQGRVLADRMVFVRQANPQKATLGKIDITTDKNKYLAYEKVKITLALKDTSLLRYGSSLSLAVRDAGNSNFTGPDNADIQAQLLLASDLKGYIVNPKWYFAANDESHRKALDLLLRTQGWRRYKWERMEGVEPFKPKQPIEEGLLVDGDIRSLLKKNPVENVDLKMWMTQGDQALQNKVKSDSLGKFAFLLPDVYGEWKLNLQTTVNNKVREFRILLDRQFSPTPKTLNAYDKQVLAYNTAAVNENSDTKTPTPLFKDQQYAIETNPTNPKGIKEYQLKEVVKTAQRPYYYKEVLRQKATVDLDVSKRISALQDQGQSEITDIFRFMTEESKYFQVAIKYGGPIFCYKGREVVFRIYPNEALSENHYLSNQKLTLELGQNSDKTGFGETYVYEPSTINTADIERILVLENNEKQSMENMEIEAKGGSKGFVMVYIILKKDFSLDPPGTRTTTYQGYAPTKEFFSPVYLKGTPVLDPDYRRTLYWNPDIALDKQGNANLEFYNNRTCKQMNVSAEGITGSGCLLKN